MVNIRKIGVIGRTYRHLNRYRQILTVFIKYGFGDLLELLKIDQYLETGLRMLSTRSREKVERLSRAQRLRMAFEELGPTYIKLGQAVSTRTDLVPGEYITEFSKLQDQVPSIDFSYIKSIIESELKLPIDQIFDAFDEKAIASASIGQVHRARLKDGEPVAVKVQRPGIRKLIEVDLEIMLHLATLMERHIEGMDLYRPVKIVEEFARTLEKEIDYTNEAANMERFAGNFLDDVTIYVPKVFKDTTAPRVLTMEYVSGIKVSEVHELTQKGLDRKIITARGAHLFLKQVFDHGFFHADPHPGNIFVLPDNVICLLDFGMMGYIDRKTRELFVDLIDSIVHRDEVKATQILLKLTTWVEEPDIRDLEKGVADIMGTHLFKPLKDIRIGKLIQQMFELVSRHRLRIPADIFLMIKSFSAMEGVGTMLDPEFDIISQAAPFLKQIKLAKLHPQRLAEDIVSISSDLLQFTQQFPKDMLEIGRLIRSKDLCVKFENQGLDTMMGTYDRISNRISFSIVIAALIIGSALIIISEIPPMMFGISMIGIIVFVAAGIMGIWLLIAILKKGRL
ncbi:MAG: AarF/ABC1/UbiB kinase family protein [Desulfobacterales bacterium]|nr:AarF/ABC1/UbiB kinase family protein [Desulfobacterales bacterium]MDD4072731.1 AarF/ABC1/UbiB kinase family protein [Desulfobacterales bacterium]MDD4392368.1 AarF/ABC1/UbiB kinase family protein [Desulfobacterales bacterium]